MNVAPQACVLARSACWHFFSASRALVSYAQKNRQGLPKWFNSQYPADRYYPHRLPNGSVYVYRKG